MSYKGIKKSSKTDTKPGIRKSETRLKVGRMVFYL